MCLQFCVSTKKRKLFRSLARSCNEMNLHIIACIKYKESRAYGRKYGTTRTIFFASNALVRPDFTLKWALCRRGREKKIDFVSLSLLFKCVMTEARKDGFPFLKE